MLPDDVSLHLVDNIEEAMNMLRWLGERREVLGLDTETGGVHPNDPLNPHSTTASLRMVQIGDHNTGWAVPFEGPRSWGGAVLEALEKYQGPIAVHNLSFDAAWMSLHAGWKVPWERMHDTMIHYNMLYPGQPAALKTITDKHIDPRASVGQAQLNAVMDANGWDWRTIPVTNPQYALYSALDPVITAHIWSFLRADQKYPKAFDLEMSTLRICTAMEMQGIPVDVDYSIKMRDELEEYVSNAKKWAQENLGISVSSSQQLAKYFEHTLGAKITKRTRGGAPSVDKETLEEFTASSDPNVAQTAKFVLEVRKADKIRGSYFENFIKDQTDGLLHPSIKTMQAITGRMSVTNPALQTLHKNDKIVRNAITARPGQVLVSSDLDQVEFRIFAHLSQDPALIETFIRADETGSDPFTEIGKQVYEDADFQKSDPRRGLIKNVVYGKLYGSGVAKMAASAGVPETQMRSVNDGLESTYPGIKRYQKELEQSIQNRARTSGEFFIETGVTGRRIPVEEDYVYRGLNYTIQSTAAEVFKSNLVKLDAAGLTPNMIVPVHDEILMSVDASDAEEVKKTLEECMTTSSGWDIPLTSGSEGPFERWGLKE